MQVVILAAGKGTRMGPLTDTQPKPMLPVADRPLVAHVADAAVAAGADELIVITGYGGESVTEYFGSRYAGVPVAYAEQERQLGTADALASAANLLDGPFAVLNGDNLYEADDLARLFAGVPRVGAYRVEDPSSYGVLVSRDGVVTDVLEKPDEPVTDTINAGAYTFPAAAIDMLDVPTSERGERELTDVLERVIGRYEVQIVPFETWLDVGRPWELLEANERRIASLKGGVAGNVHEDATLRGPAVIEEGATVDAGVVIEGPVLLRSGSSVGPNAYVRGPTLVDCDAEVGHAVEVKNSVVLRGASVSHLSYVGDSIVGPRANLGAGTNVANLRHDDEPVEVTVGDRRVSTDRRKFGTVIGPDAKTGINTSINAGVTLSSGATTAPGEAVLRDR